MIYVNIFTFLVHFAHFIQTFNHGGFMKKIYFYFLILFCFLFFACCVTTFVVYSGNSFITNSLEYDFSNIDYSWPLLKHYAISSAFGFRISPTTGASTYHSGIDIPAPEKTPIYSVADGIVTYLDFEGANGYTLKIENGSMLFSYSHIAPDFLVNIGDSVTKNQEIAQVGPKYISPILGNPYTDSTGNQTNGATTGCHLHLSIKIDGKAIDPLTLFR